MFDFHEKRKIRSILYSKPVIGVLFALSILLSFSVYNRYSIAEEMQHKLDAKRSELEALTVRAESLDSKVKYLEDERGIEEELRNRFDVAKEGEQVVILLDDRKVKTDTEKSALDQNTATTEATTTEKSFFGKLLFWRN